MRSFLLILLLIAGPAWAQDGDAEPSGEADEAPETEGDKPAETEGEAEPAPSTGSPETDAKPAPGPAPTAEPSEAAPATEVWPPTEPEPVREAVPEPPRRAAAEPDETEAEIEAEGKEDDGLSGYKKARKRARKARLELAAKRGIPAYFVVHLGGSNVSVFDEGLLRWQDAPSIAGFSSSLDVYLHERIAVSVGGSVSEWRETGINAPGADRVSFSVRTGAIDGAAKLVITPPYWPVRPYVRAGGGVRLAAVRIEQGGDNVDKRFAEGAAPYATVGLGVELTTPRIIYGVNIPWGIGLRFEGGGQFGGGGTTPAAPSVDLGDFGRLDLGPLYFQGGLVLLF